jgi:hypothetical protein
MAIFLIYELSYHLSSQFCQTVNCLVLTLLTTRCLLLTFWIIKPDTTHASCNEIIQLQVIYFLLFTLASCSEPSASCSNSSSSCPLRSCCCLSRSLPAPASHDLTILIPQKALQYSYMKLSPVQNMLEILVYREKCQCKVYIDCSRF